MSEQATDYLDVLSQPSTEPELAAQASKKKRKMSPKQKAAAMRNLKKAHAKSARARGKRHKALKALPKKLAAAKKSVAKRASRKASPKQIAAAKKNIKKAQAALRAKSKTKRLTTRAAARSTARKSEATSMKKGKRSKGKRKMSRKQLAAARKNIKKAQAARRSKGKRSGKKGKKHTLATRKASRAVRPPTPKRAVRRKGGKTKRRFTQKARAAALRNLGKAMSARKRAKAAGRKHPVRAYSYHSRPKRVKVPAHRSYERHHKQSRKARAASIRNLKKARAALRHGGRRRGGRAHEGYMEAMVNALTGVEIVIGGLSMTVWFMVTDFVDRLLATHALTDKGAKDAAGNELYADTPPTTGDYAGLFNATAICAPMNVTRWLVGLLGMTGVPFALSFAVSNDVGRAALQAASGGAAIRIVGKALIDLVAYVTMWTPLGQQLYDGEMRAQVYASGNTDPLASLPSTGLGAKQTGTGAPAAEGDKAEKKNGTGWPSMPRETANAGSTGGEGGAPLPPAVQPVDRGQPQAGQPGYLAGLPPKRPNPFLWGHKEQEQEEVAA